MNTVKKYLGIIWMLAAVAAIVLLVNAAFTHIGHGKEDINKPMPWIIIITIFTPIAVGLGLFGWYSLKDEYHTS
jgi:Zn-dependent protease with chaperone function